MFYYLKLKKIVKTARKLSNMYFIDNIEYAVIKSDLDDLAFRIKKASKKKSASKQKTFNLELFYFTFDVYSLKELFLINENLYELVGNAVPINKTLVNNIINDISYRAYNYDKLVKYCDEYLEDIHLTSGAIEDMFAILYGDPKVLKDVINTFDENKCQLLIKKFYDEIKRIQDYVKEKEEQRIQSERETLEDNIKNYIETKTTFNEKINISDSRKNYPLTNIKKFVNKPTFRNGVIVKDRINYLGNYYSEEQLISMIVNEANPYALYKYICGVALNQITFDLSLKDNIEYILNNISIEDSYVFGYIEKPIYKTSIGVICKYLMYYCGIIYEKDQNTASRLLFNNSSILHDEYLLSNESLIKKYVLQYSNAIGVFNDYTSLVCKILSWGSTWSFVVPFDVYISYLTYIQKKEGNEFVVKFINKINVDYIKEALKRHFIKLFTVEEIIEENNEEIVNEKKEKTSPKKKEEEKPIEIEKVEELSKKTKDADAMKKVGSYYFYQAYDNLKYDDYLKSSEYYILAGDLGNKSAYYSAGIAFRNYAVAQNDPILKQKYFNEAIDIFYKYSMKDFSCAFAFIVYEKDSQNKYENHYLKLLNYYRKDKNVKPYYIEMLEAYLSKEYYKIYCKIVSLMDELERPPYAFIILMKEIIFNIDLGKPKNIMDKYEDIIKIENFDDIYKNDNDFARAIEYLLAYRDDKNLRLMFAEMLAKGNCFIKKNIRRAYKILKEFNGNFPEKKEYYSELFTSIENELLIK